LGALKFYLLKVEPSKRMLFNPEESIDFQGDTGPFVQYTYARICSVLRQAGDSWKTKVSSSGILHETETETLFTLYHFPDELKKAAETYNPAILAAYCLRLAKAFNRVYKEVSLLKEPDENIKIQRLKLAAKTGEVIKTCMKLLGIDCPERM
jgi:arginyl-tRNA synthetase